LVAAGEIVDCVHATEFWAWKSWAASSAAYDRFEKSIRAAKPESVPKKSQAPLGLKIGNLKRAIFASQKL